jgi:hypothetical protein
MQSAPTSYGSFSVGTPACVPEELDHLRREADLAQRERELAERERQFEERQQLFLWCDLQALNFLGHSSVWRDAPIEFQPLCRRLWQFWVHTALVLAVNWVCQITLNLSGSDPENRNETEPMAADRATSSATGEPVLATLLLFGGPITSWLAWVHPLTEAAQLHALQHGTSGGPGSGRVPVLWLGGHTALCALGALGPPGTGLAGYLVALEAARCGHEVSFTLSLLTGLSFAALAIEGLLLLRWVLALRLTPSMSRRSTTTTRTCSHGSTPQQTVEPPVLQQCSSGRTATGTVPPLTPSPLRGDAYGPGYGRI